MSTSTRRRKRQSPPPLDHGPPIRLARGDIVLEGAVRPRGRALGIVDELQPELRVAAAAVLRLLGAAHTSGFALSNLECTGAGGELQTPSERAEAARRRLAAIRENVGPLQWSAIVDLLWLGKSAEIWAFEIRGQGYRFDRRSAKAVLSCALDAVAAMRGSPGPEREAQPQAR